MRWMSTNLYKLVDPILKLRAPRLIKARNQALAKINTHEESVATLYDGTKKYISGIIKEDIASFANVNNTRTTSQYSANTISN